MAIVLVLPKNDLMWKFIEDIHGFILNELS